MRGLVHNAKYWVIGLLSLVCLLYFFITGSLLSGFIPETAPLRTRNPSYSRKVLKKAYGFHETYEENPPTKILCWVLTQDKNLPTKTQAIKDTWGKRCDKTLYFSTAENVTFPTIGLTNVTEGRRHLTEKTFQAFTYCYMNHGSEFDWFLKADDDTYVVVENLRAFLGSFDPNEPSYFGYRFKPYTPQGFMSGGAGYVLSQEALRLFVKDGIEGGRCRKPAAANQYEDVDVGKCLSDLGVEAQDSLDAKGLERFHPINLISYFYSKFMPAWIHNHTMSPVKPGFDCCSEQTISFHYVRPPEMYMLDLLLYHIKISKPRRKFLQK